jgi:serine/threonine-protein kinase
MSPEQARGRAKMVDGQSDVYAVGATMFTLLSGQLVHGSEITISEYVAATFTTQARSVRSVAPHVPEPIIAIVDRALRLEKKERWPSAAEMLAKAGRATSFFRDDAVVCVAMLSGGRAAVVTRDARTHVHTVG